MKNHASHVFLWGALVALCGWGNVEGSTVPGSCLEEWALPDFQPLSATYGKVVPSSSLRQRTTVIMLLSSG